MNDPFPVFPPGKAVIFNGHGKPFEFITRPILSIKPGEILVKTLYTTLCGSDIHTYCGRRIEPPQVVLGHEIVGEINWIDPAHPGVDFRGERIHVGDTVTWSIFSLPAGVIPPRPDMPQKSPSLFKYGHVLADGNDVFNGGLADYCILRSNTALIKIPESIPLKVGATISCAHSTVAGACRVAGNIAGKRVLVFGAGLLGLSCLAMCKEAGASHITVVDPEPGRLHWGKKFGADVSSNLPTAEADVVFDMTGNPEAMRMGIEYLAVGGCAVWIGAVYPAAPVSIDAQMVVRKLLQIRGLHNYNYEDFVTATAFIENNYWKYPFDSLVEKEFSLDEVEAAFSYACDQKPVRVGIQIRQTNNKL